jgi:hydrogenase expression/formation protein HypD
VRVPGIRTSLDEAKSRGGRVEVVTSPLQTLDIARSNPQEQVVFLTVGFETTTPASAKAIVNAKHDGIKNLSFFVSHKIVPPALSVLVADRALEISGFLLPGHVSAIIGQKPYQLIAEAGLPGVITGFEPLDILSGIFMVCDMLRNKKAAILNAYTRIARPEGNPVARKTVSSVFEIADSLWRGIGMLPMSGLAIKKEYKKFDAVDRFGLALDGAADMPRACSCGDVLKGRIRPDECLLFAKTCTPETPVGPCMVSSEGSCAAYFKYGA